MPTKTLPVPLKKPMECFFYLKRSFAALTPSIFLPLYKAFIRPHLEYAIQASSPILSRDCQALESVQKLAVKFVKGLRHVPYETGLQRLQLFSLVRRILCGDLIYMYKTLHDLLDFPCDAVFAAPTRTGLRGHALKIHQQRCKTRRRQHAFSVRVVPYWNKLPEGIVTATSVETLKSRQITMAAPLPRSSPLTRPPNSPPPYVFHPVISNPMLLMLIF